MHQTCFLNYCFQTVKKSNPLYQCNKRISKLFK